MNTHEQETFDQVVASVLFELQDGKSVGYGWLADKLQPYEEEFSQPARTALLQKLQAAVIDNIVSTLSRGTIQDIIHPNSGVADLLEVTRITALEFTEVETNVTKLVELFAHGDMNQAGRFAADKRIFEREIKNVLADLQPKKVNQFVNWLDSNQRDAKILQEKKVLNDAVDMGDIGNDAVVALYGIQAKLRNYWQMSVREMVGGLNPGMTELELSEAAALVEKYGLLANALYQHAQNRQPTGNEDRLPDYSITSLLGLKPHS